MPKPQFFSRFKTSQRRRGSVLVYAMVLMVIIVGFTSFAVDFGTAQMAKTQLRATVDAAALAGSSALNINPATVRARAKAIAALNQINGAPLVLLDSDIELGTWNATTAQFTVLTGSSESLANSVRVNGQMVAARGTGISLPFLATISSRKTIDIKTSAVGASALDAVDLVLVQDVSGSFAGEIAVAKTGDTALLNSLNITGSKSNFGIAAFTGTAKTISTSKNVPANLTSLQSSIISLSVGGTGMPSTISGTDIAAGMEQGLAIMNAISSPNPSRSLVIVSDGEPTSSWLGAHPFYTSSQLLAIAQSDANTAWSQGINVYVVFWNATNDTTAAANLKSLVRGKGTFVNVTDPANLPTAIGLLMSSQCKLVR